MTLRPEKQFIGKMCNDIEIIKLFAITLNDCLSQSDAVICLEGDGYNRIAKTVEIFTSGLAQWVVVTGGLDRPPFSILAQKLGQAIIKAGVPKERVILEDRSQNTWEQAVKIMELAKEKAWQRIILIASAFHQPRAYLTFLKAMKIAKMKIQVFNGPVNNLWFEETVLGSRIELLVEETQKIKDYQKKGHLVTIKEALEYHQWKEEQKNSRVILFGGLRRNKSES